jgi:hypothetical protein
MRLSAAVGGALLGLGIAVASPALFLDGDALPQDFIYGCATSAYQVTHLSFGIPR